MSMSVRRFGAIVVKLLHSFGLPFEESLRWPASNAKLQTSLCTTGIPGGNPQKYAVKKKNLNKHTVGVAT
jgi:hypothetical protein